MPAPILWRAAMTPRPAVRFLDESGQPLHDSGGAGQTAAAGLEHADRIFTIIPKPGPASLATSGLSLAGVNGTLRASGALLAVESESTRGTTFTVHFPHRSNSPEGAGEPASPPPGFTRAS